MMQKPKIMSKETSDRLLGNAGAVNNNQRGGGKIKSIANIEPLTRGLAIKLKRNKLFERYNIFIVHNTDVRYLHKELTIDNLFSEFKDEIKMYNSKKTTESLAEQIKLFEKQSYRSGKSVIILTGAKLRLGISLPCVDVAFNFDNMKSIDVNYQTMFRVLTERTKPVHKKFGYYVDFNFERSIQFIYEYGMVYGDKSAKKTIDERVKYLQTLLFSFNYNGLNIVNKSGGEEVQLYNKLIERLSLTKEGYITHMTQNIHLHNLIKKGIASSNDQQQLRELAKLLRIKFKDGKKNETLQLKKGIVNEAALAREEPDLVENFGPSSTNKDTEEEDDEFHEDNLIIFLADHIPPIISLLALFSNELDDCNDITECIDNVLKNMNDFAEYCNCESYDNANIIDCYINSPNNALGSYKYDKNMISRLLHIIKQQIASNSILQEALEIKFRSIIQEMRKSKGPLIVRMGEEDIKKFVTNNLAIKIEEKEKFGEVFTPPELIKEMLDKLPKSVWKNPNYKWLDPANGIGNFPMIVYSKLMKELDDIPESKRSQHIIKNMLYMVELNPKNVKISRKIFGEDANIICGSFLSDDYNSVNPKVIKEFGVEKFDVIMGNPPWNDMKVGVQSGSRAKNSLWDKFIIVSFTILQDKGYLTFINPSQWRGLGPEYHKIWNLLSERQIMYLHTYGETQGQKLFNVSQRFDLYILKNTNNTKQTEIIDELGNNHSIDLTKMPFLPNYAYNEINNILTSEDKGIDVIMSYSAYFAYKKNNEMSQTKKGKYIYPVVHRIRKEGIIYWYSNDNTKGHFGVPKVILNFGRHQYSHKEQNDYKGEYGMSQISFGIPIQSKKEGDEILKAIDSNAFKKIIAATKWGAFQTDYRMFKYFKKDFYKHPMFQQKIRSKERSKSSSKTRSKERSKSLSKTRSKERSKSLSKTRSKERSKSLSKTRSKERSKSLSKSKSNKGGSLSGRNVLKNRTIRRRWKGPFKMFDF